MPRTTWPTRVPIGSLMDLTQTPQRLDAFAAMAWTWTVEFLPRLTTATLIVVLGAVAARWISRAVANLASGSGRVDETVQPVIGSVVRYGIMILVLVAALGQIGVQTASLLAVLGAAGLAIGLALQGSLANIAAGIMLLWLRPFRIGDYIEVATSTGIAGTVREIGLFACTIETFDGVIVFAPNSAIWNSAIRNHTRNAARLLSFTVTVPLGEDPARAGAALLEMAQKSDHVIDHPPPDVFIDTMQADGLRLVCRFWVPSQRLGQAQRSLIAEARSRLQKRGAPESTQIVRTVPPDSDPSRLLGSGAHS
jgi:small conductance mechanosensitive channel